MSNATEVVLAVDGGATRTRAWIVRLDGTVQGRGAAGSSNVFDRGIDASRRVIAAATREAWRESGLPGRKPCGFLAVFGGVAGAGASEEQRALASALAAEFGVNPVNVCIDHDLRIALAGALGGEPGVVILAGTGSAAYGRDASGREARAGGWGTVLDDGGSGQWIGMQAMRLVIRVADGRTTATPLVQAVVSHLGVTSPRAMLNRLQPAHPQHLQRADVATLAPVVIAAAHQGDPAACDILERGAAELAEMAAAAGRRLTDDKPDGLRFAGAGGLLEHNPSYFARVAKALAARVPGARLEPPQLPPIAGAVLLALEMAGTRPSADLRQNLVAV